MILQLFVLVSISNLASSLSSLSLDDTPSPFRPPSVPLIVNGPYLSIWSPADRLFDTDTEHWSGAVQPLLGLIKVDGICYRFMGADDTCNATMTQVNLTVFATNTSYEFEAGGVSLILGFVTPALMYDLDMMALPTSVIRFSLWSNDGKEHFVSLYFDNNAQVCTTHLTEIVHFDRSSISDNGETLSILKMGTHEQEFNGNEGADTINWGYWYLGVDSHLANTAVGPSQTEARLSFARGEKLAPDNLFDRAVNDFWPVLAVSFDLQLSGDKSRQNRHLVVGYDVIIGMRYFGEDMLPFWRNRWDDLDSLISYMHSRVDILILNCSNFNTYVFNDLAHSGQSVRYATLGGLAYRQVTGAMTAVWNHKLQERWFFLKEINSSGDVSTVDVLYPTSPVILYYNPELLRLLLMPVLAYANNETMVYGVPKAYNLSWAPHNLGHWPICDLAAVKQKQMPVEETGNMFIMLAAIAKFQKKVAYLGKYWGVLGGWAEFLMRSLPDPGNQLCTDDFEGPSPHNVNLAAKGIVGLGAYAQLLGLKGDIKSTELMNKAVSFSEMWEMVAYAFDHYKLQYNLSVETWSQKYNLYFQKVLNLDIFDNNTFKLESDFYQTKMDTFDVPLDSRAKFTKTDWLMWTATFGTLDQWNSTLNAVYEFADKTPERVPFSDMYFTDTGKMNHFKARPVIGGIWAKALLGKPKNVYDKWL